MKWTTVTLRLMGSYINMPLIEQHLKVGKFVFHYYVMVFKYLRINVITSPVLYNLYVKLFHSDSCHKYNSIKTHLSDFLKMPQKKNKDYYLSLHFFKFSPSMQKEHYSKAQFEDHGEFTIYLLVVLLSSQTVTH